MRILYLSFLLFLINTVCAKEFNQNVLTTNFKEVKNHSQFLKFVGKSTKLGFITTEFEGYAKQFNLEYDLTENELKSMHISIVANQLDTNSSMRDSKMHELCLKAVEHKTIEAFLKKPVSLTVAKGQVPIELIIMNQPLILTADYQLKNNESTIEIEFETEFSFVEAKIPDPSIAIAKVDEKFKIIGKLQLSKK